MLGYEDLNTNLSINEDWWYEGVYALLIASILDIIKKNVPILILQLRGLFISFKEKLAGSSRFSATVISNGRPVHNG